MIKIHLSRLLGEKRWSQAYLANRTDIRPNTINAIYNEFIDRISLEHVDRICDVLGCDLSEFLGYIPNNPELSGCNRLKWLHCLYIALMNTSIATSVVNIQTTVDTATGAVIYTVNPGDSLWAIASRLLGNGIRYIEIMALNGLKSDVIRPGQVLKIPAK